MSLVAAAISTAIPIASGVPVSSGLIGMQDGTAFTSIKLDPDPNSIFISSQCVPAPFLSDHVANYQARHDCKKYQENNTFQSTPFQICGGINV